MITKGSFKAPWWLKNAHLQTIWSSAFRKIPELVTRHECFELSDGDYLDLEWLVHTTNEQDSPILILLHGLEGSIDSTYIGGILNSSQNSNWRTMVMHFRSCGQEMNRLARSYHSGETEDLNEVLTALKERNPEAPIFVAGFSLGGNVLLKYLGESQKQSLIKGAVAVSVPFLLSICSKKLDKGLSRIYRYYLLKQLKTKTLKKLPQLLATLSLSEKKINNISNFYEFDDKITAPLHGFDGASDYYQKASSRQYLKSIQTETLIIQAKDDPFMTEEVIPDEHELSEYVTLELSNDGGHVGFISGQSPLSAVSFLDKRITDWLTEQLMKSN